MKSAKIFLTVAVVSVFLFIGWSNALAMQSVGGNLNGFSILDDTGKQIGVGSWIPSSPTDKKPPADER